MHHVKPHFLNRPAKVHLGGSWFLFLEPIYLQVGTIQVSAPKYTISDLGSTPWFLRWLAPKVDDWIRACGIHDHHCFSKIIPRWIADAFFVVAMQADGLSRWRIPFMYLGVRIGAWLPGEARIPEHIQNRANEEIRQREGYLP